MTQTTPSATAAICTAATCTAATSTAAKSTAIVVKCFFDFFAFLFLSWLFLQKKKKYKVSCQQAIFEQNCCCQSVSLYGYIYITHLPEPPPCLY